MESEKERERIHKELMEHHSKPENRIKEIIGAAEELLITAKAGQQYLESTNDIELMMGLRIVIIFARHVTNVLQRIRGIDDDFDIWYLNWKKEMKSDPFLKFVYNLRNSLLKEGLRPFQYTIGLCESDFDHPHVRKLNESEFAEISSLLGKMNTVITSEYPTYYFVDIDIQNCPDKMLNHKIKHKNPKTVCELYLSYIEKLLKSCKEHYSIDGQYFPAPIIK